MWSPIFARGLSGLSARSSLLAEKDSGALTCWANPRAARREPWRPARLVNRAGLV